jgi:type I restriction enzyme S subunit
MSLTLRPISEFVHQIRMASQAAMQPDERLSYIDLSAVDKEEKHVVSEAVKPLTWAEAPSRARQIVQTNDILVSTVRPNLNGVAQLGAEHDGAIASTGFCVLRANPDVLDSRYLFHWVCSPQFVTEMIKQATGASYPAVSDRIILESLIPYPDDLNDQRRIAAALDKAYTIRKKRRDALKLADAFLRSAFLDLFGHLFSGGRAEWVPLSECTDFIDYRGKTPEKSASGVRFITAKNVRDGVINIEPAEFISEETYRHWMTRGYPLSGDVLFTTEAPLGNVAVLRTNERVSVGQRLIAIRPKKGLLPDFLSWAMRQDAIKRDIISRATGSTVKGIRSAELVQVRVPIPETAGQVQFENLVTRLDQQKALMNRFASEAETLFQSLQQQAFA